MKCSYSKPFHTELHQNFLQTEPHLNFLQTEPHPNPLLQGEGTSFLLLRKKIVYMKNLKIHITKSWRKSISMKFDTQGVLLVKAPMFISRTCIDDFLKKHAGWIEQQQQKIEEQKVEKKWYLFGEVFM